MSDAILLAAILRLMSGVIHTLTASYSSDTVYALAITGVIIHLLACDYNYANGISTDGDGQASSLNTFAHPRPAFLGGTVSLNAVFFSTALLVSRIEADASSYAFVSLVVTLFAFYPATRHNIAGRYPNSLCKTDFTVVCHWFLFLLQFISTSYFLRLTRGITLFYHYTDSLCICVVDNNIVGEDNIPWHSMDRLDTFTVYSVESTETQADHHGAVGYCSYFNGGRWQNQTCWQCSACAWVNILAMPIT